MGWGGGWGVLLVGGVKIKSVLEWMSLPLLFLSTNLQRPPPRLHPSIDPPPETARILEGVRVFRGVHQQLFGDAPAQHARAARAANGVGGDAAKGEFTDGGFDAWCGMVCVWECVGVCESVWECEKAREREGTHTQK